MSKTQGPTYNPSKIKRIRKFGFMKRNASADGKKVLKRKILKGRHSLSVSAEFGTKMEKDKKFSRRKR